MAVLHHSASASRLVFSQSFMITQKHLKKYQHVCPQNIVISSLYGDHSWVN